MLIKPGTKVSLKNISTDDTGRFRSAEEAGKTLDAHLQELIKLQIQLPYPLAIG